MELSAIQIAAAASGSSALAMGATFFHVSRLGRYDVWPLQRPEAGLAYIGAAFVLAGLRQLILIAGWAGVPVVFLLTDLILVAVGLLLLVGACRLTERRVPLRPLLLIGGALAVNSIVTYALGLAAGVYRAAGFLPIILFVCVSFFAVGLMFLRYQRRYPGFGYGLAAGLFLTLAVAAAPSPFVQPIAWLMPPYLLLGMFLYLAIALCLIVATQRRQQDAVLASQDRFRRVLQALDRSHRGIVMEDEASRAIYINDTAQHLLGPGASATAMMEQAGCAAELREKGAWSGDIVYPRGGESDVVLSVSSARLPDGGLVMLVEDATLRLKHERERKALERQLQEAQKLESVGQLAGGIAHDFNNLVGAIQGFANFIAEDTAAASPLHTYAERILNATRRAKRLIQQILAFSRRDEAPRENLRLRELVMESADLLKATLPATSRLTLDNRVPDAVVSANATKIIQILINLCLNASDALAGRPGTIAMSVDRLPPDDPRLRRLTMAATSALAVESQSDGMSVCYAGSVTPGRDYLVVSVSDMGGGIDPGILARIFDPFFTTKSRGRGTGLGLAVVHGLVLAHEGGLVVASKPGTGTRFDVVLPLLSEAKPDRPREAAAPKPQRPRSQRGRILVVDDDEAFADMLVTALDRVGYEAAVSTDPAEAIEAFQAGPDLWDVLVTDYTMPEMTGLDLTAKMKALNPNLACILCTGFAGGDFDRTRALNGGVDAFFSKPIETTELLKMISLLIDAAHGRRLAAI